MPPVRRYRGSRNTYTGALGDRLMAELHAALAEGSYGKGWCATCGHHHAEHHEVDGCGACALAYDRHNPRHDFTPTLPVGDG